MLTEPEFIDIELKEDIAEAVHEFDCESRSG